MNEVSKKIDFEYEFVSKKGVISNKDRGDVSSILAVDALFAIKINDEIYFEAELAILEFYKSLLKWKESLAKDHIGEFHYYTIEYDDYEEGAILSLLPYSNNQARVISIWAESDVNTVFDVEYIVTKFCKLEENLREDIENYFNINLKYFIKHIPFTLIR